MSQAANVHSIEDHKAESDAQHEAIANEVRAKAGGDMGKAAIFISLLSVLLLVVFFFGLNQNITHLSEEVEALSAMRQDIAAVTSQVAGVQGEVRAAEQAIGQVDGRVSDVDGRVSDVDGKVGQVAGAMASIEGRVVELEKLPAKTRNMIIVNDLNSMGEKLGYIGSQLSAQEATKLNQARQLLQQLQSDLAK